MVVQSLEFQFECPVENERVDTHLDVQHFFSSKFGR